MRLLLHLLLLHLLMSHHSGHMLTQGHLLLVHFHLLDHLLPVHFLLHFLRCPGIALFCGLSFLIATLPGTLKD